MEKKFLSATRKAMPAPLVEENISLLSNDPERRFAAISSVSSTMDAMQSVNDRAIHELLKRLFITTTPRNSDCDRCAEDTADLRNSLYKSRQKWTNARAWLRERHHEQFLRFFDRCLLH